MYAATITTHADGQTTRETYPEPTAELMISSALRQGFTLTADPAAATLTLTGNGRTITLAPAEPLAPLTPAQRRALLALAAHPAARLSWVYSRRSVPHLEHAGHALSHAVSVALAERGMVTDVRQGHDASLTLRAWLALGRAQRQPDAAAAILRDAYGRTRATV